MDRCGKYEEILTRYVHGDVLLQEKDALEAHLAVCPDCERLYRDVRSVDTALHDLPGKLVDPPPWLKGRILAHLEEEAGGRAPAAWGRWAVLAGAAACLLAVAVLYTDGFREPLRLARVPDGPPVSGAAAKRVPEAIPPGASASAVASPKNAAPEGSGKVSPPAAAPKDRQATARAPRVEIIKEVRIFFYCPPAARVAVTGDFNAWNPEGVPMSPGGRPGLWETTLRLKPGAYSYNFIVDGNILVPDPDAPNQMPDGFGGTNSILLVRKGNSV